MKEGPFMAITHKRQDDLETMFASIANFPDLGSDPNKDEKENDENKDHSEKATK